ncbi:unnamed protein product (mitochondrion) [Plasmodiophora brassicae]|uniref:Uncharacterized protein n=1 Tax=Plasmodiophora brassicae TaxID=37360 RepID=A0A0G4J7A0_PLABS|nr:hypothetical protein PBRA_003225 [Plasmodiophora brassicae]SPQ95696.1 unnamed protein product [Plasmodiophora brassicae]
MGKRRRRDADGMVAVASPDADVSGVVSRWACVLAEQGGSGILTARLAELDRFAGDDVEDSAHARVFDIALCHVALLLPQYCCTLLNALSTGGHDRIAHVLSAVLSQADPPLARSVLLGLNDDVRLHSLLARCVFSLPTSLQDAYLDAVDNVPEQLLAASSPVSFRALLIRHRPGLRSVMESVLAEPSSQATVELFAQFPDLHDVAVSREAFQRHLHAPLLSALSLPDPPSVASSLLARVLQDDTLFPSLLLSPMCPASVIHSTLPRSWTPDSFPVTPIALQVLFSLRPQYQGTVDDILLSYAPTSSDAIMWYCVAHAGLDRAMPLFLQTIHLGGAESIDDTIVMAAAASRLSPVAASSLHALASAAETEGHPLSRLLQSAAESGRVIVSLAQACQYRVLEAVFRYHIPAPDLAGTIVNGCLDRVAQYGDREAVRVVRAIWSSTLPPGARILEALNVSCAHADALAECASGFVEGRDLEHFVQTTTGDLTALSMALRLLASINDAQVAVSVLTAANSVSCHLRPEDFSALLDALHRFLPHSGDTIQQWLPWIVSKCLLSTESSLRQKASRLVLQAIPKDVVERHIAWQCRRLERLCDVPVKHTDDDISLWLIKGFMDNVSDTRQM